MANPSQLLLLADHIKLSLLERRGAILRNIEPTARDADISRSLATLREGVEKLEATGTANDIREVAARLRSQYNDLESQFSPSEPTQPSHSAQIPTSSLKRPPGATAQPSSKFVRFTDAPPSPTTAAARAALLPYSDDPATPLYSDAEPDASMSNEAIHAQHATIMREQDTQLDALGVSVGRQRELSVAIGGELDEQGVLLDEVDGYVDRHQSQIDRARKRVEGVARTAKDNMGLSVIFVLIVILILLIVVF